MRLKRNSAPLRFCSYPIPCRPYVAVAVRAPVRGTWVLRMKGRSFEDLHQGFVPNGAIFVTSVLDEGVFRHFFQSFGCEGSTQVFFFHLVI
jgi:hypothetical protein